MKRVKPRWKPASARAVARGMAMARFFGTSSPKIIVTAVARMSAIATATGEDGAIGKSESPQRGSQQMGDGGLSQETDGQIGDGDPELGPRQLGGQRP